MSKKIEQKTLNMNKKALWTMRKDKLIKLIKTMKIPQ